MLDKSVHMVVLLRRAVKHPKRGAFQQKRTRFAKALGERMAPQWWPFNAPRPQRAHLWTITSPSTISVTKSDHSTEESSAEDAEIQTAIAVPIENVTGRRRVLSWRKTPLSKIKVREPIPAEILFGSIDAAIAEEHLLPKGLLDSTKVEEPASPTNSILPLYHRESSGIGSEISRVIELAWKTNYEWVQDLKAGAQGDVALYTHKETSRLTVVKTIRTRDSDHMTHIVDGMPHEAKILQDYIKPHPNLVEMKTIFNDPKLQTCRIVMDYCDGGDLYDFTHYWLASRRQQIPEIFLLHFIVSIGEALAWLHLGATLVSPNGFGLPRIVQHHSHVPILHRDIKLENIFLRLSPYNSQGLPYIVLGDFGGAVVESECDDWFGTPGYYPPEVQRYQRDDAQGSRHHLQRKFQVMTTASDIYTVAATFCHMILLGGWNQNMDIDFVFWRSTLNDWGLLREFMRECLADSPKERPNTQTFLDIAAVLKAHVAASYHCGIYMPENSWPTRQAPRDVDQDANRSESTLKPQMPKLPIFPRFGTGDTSAVAGPESSAALPSHVAVLGRATPVTAIQNPIQVPRPALPSRRASVVNPRNTVLYEIVERLANQFPGFSRTSSIRRSIASRRSSRTQSRAQNPVPLERPPPTPLVSKFSADSDLSPTEPAKPEASTAELKDVDIEFVMLQTGVDRELATKTLKENNNDLVDAILALTQGNRFGTVSSSNAHRIS